MKKRVIPTVVSQAVIIIPEQTIIVGNQSVAWDHPARGAILKAIKAKSWVKVQELMSPLKAIVSYGKGKLAVRVIDNSVIYKDAPVDPKLSARLIQMMQQNLPIDYLLRFVDKTRANPSFRAQNELYGFLEYGQLPITQDGDFLARKVVRPDFYDKHSRTVLYKPGTTVKMERRLVDDDSSRTCSNGLHVYSKEYGAQFASPGDFFLVVKINPTNVVAVPPDYSNTKMRVCEMFVVQKLEAEDDPKFFGKLTYGNRQEKWF